MVANLPALIPTPLPPAHTADKTKLIFRIPHVISLSKVRGYTYEPTIVVEETVYYLKSRPRRSYRLRLFGRTVLDRERKRA